VTDSLTSPDLNGLRVLVVEDEAAISLLLEDMLLDFGCEVIGPAARLAAALDAVERETVDLAILDVNVAGEPMPTVPRRAVTPRQTAKTFTDLVKPFSTWTRTTSSTAWAASLVGARRGWPAQPTSSALATRVAMAGRGRRSTGAFTPR